MSLPPPSDFDRAFLGSREVAGWALIFGQQRERCSPSFDYIEVYERSAFDEDLARWGPRKAVFFEHAFGAQRWSREGEPIGHATVTVHEQGLWAVGRLDNSTLSDEVLAAARVGEVGWSISAVDENPLIEDGAPGELPRVVRRRMTLHELTLTFDPAGAPATMICAAEGRQVQRIPFFNACHELLNKRGEDPKQRLWHEFSEKARRRTKTREHWFGEIRSALDRVHRAAALRRDGLVTMADFVEGNARELLNSFNLEADTPNTYTDSAKLVTPRGRRDEWVDIYAWRREETRLGIRPGLIRLDQPL
jgi:hypothetical protein